MKSKVKAFTVLLIFANLLQSCSYKVQLKDNEHFLWRQKFEGNEHANEDELMDLIPQNQRENRKPLGLPITPGVSVYAFGKNIFNDKKNQEKLDKAKDKLAALPEVSPTNKIERQKQRLIRKIQRLELNKKEGVGSVFRFLGSPKAIISDEQIKETSNQIKTFYSTIGYMDAEVEGQIKPTKNGKMINLTYEIKENDPYTIDSVIYQIIDPQLDSLFMANMEEPAVTKGDLFDIRLVDKEKSRLEGVAKDNGYYSFSSQYILSGSNNAEQSLAVFKEQKHGNLYFQVKNPVGKDQHPRYRIAEITFKAFDPNSTIPKSRLDTVLKGDISFITPYRKFPMQYINERVVTKIGDWYDIDDINASQRQMSYLNQFQFTTSQIFIKDSTKVKLEYFAPLLKKFTFSAEPGIANIYTNGSNYIGFNLPFGLTVRNLLNRFETTDLNFNAAYQWQPSPIDINSRPRPGFNVSLNGSFNFPELVFINGLFKDISSKNPKTKMGLGVNSIEPYWGSRFNTSMFATYSFQPSTNRGYTFSLLDINLINTKYTDKDFYDQLIILQEQGNNLKTTFDPQFVSSLSFNFIYNNADLTQPYGDSRFLRLFFESGGTFMNFSKNKDYIPFIEKYFPIQTSSDSIVVQRSYFQYLKFIIDYNQSIPVGYKASTAFKVNIGIANPYGKNRSMPYEKNFFAGGSNSIRAWSPRALGVGSAPSDTTTLGTPVQQPGDIQLETSIEYRKKVTDLFGGEIQLAGFLDAGNVWKWYNPKKESQRDRANFDFKRFYKEIALGMGAGIRWDLDFFLLRFDWGVKVFDPQRPEKDRFVLNKFKFKKFLDDGSRNLYRLNLNFGIGYPF